MEIVKMEKSHCAALAELEAACFSDPWSAAALEEETENSAASFFTAVEDGEILGYAGMQFSCGECYVVKAAVRPDRRRQGIGRALMAALIGDAVSRRGEFISLEVRPSNRSAIALYKALGFAEAGRRKNFYTRPKEDGLIMTKYL